MKPLLLLLMAGMCNAAFSQKQLNDLYVGQPYLTDANGGPLNSANIGIRSNIKLHVDFLNLEQVNSIPAGTAKISIGLGDKLDLAYSTNLSTSPLSNFFNWSIVKKNNEKFIVGTLNKTLPPNFAGLAVFDLQASAVGNSVSTSEAFINSNNLSVEDPELSNNYAELAYTVNTVWPVTFTSFNVSNVSCDIKPEWNASHQLNIDHYEVEISKTGLVFNKIASVKNSNQTNYQARVGITDIIKAPIVYVRIKAIGYDGTEFYSNIATVDGECGMKKQSKFYVFPNPISDVNFINVAAREGTLDGKYRLTLLDKFGKVYQVKEMTFANITSLKFPLSPTMHSGKYILQIAKADGSAATSLEFEKVQ